MTYSVYNYATKAYDYYFAPTKATAHAPKPPSAAGASSLGATPEQAAWPLPAGARRIGAGPNPRGRIAVQKDVLDSLSGTFDSTTNVVAAAGLGYLVWRFFFRKG